MHSMAQRTRSVWMSEIGAAPSLLTRSLTTQVAVVGAGLGGLTTAYLLAPPRVTEETTRRA